MANILMARDALNLAQGCSKGLDALVSLMSATEDNNAPPLHDLADLLFSLQRDLDSRLSEVDRALKG